MVSNNEIGKQGLEGLEEQIYSLTKKIIEKHLPGKLLHFELDWHVLWGEIRKFGDKHPSKWKVSDIELTSSTVFHYPSNTENQEVLDISVTVALISRELMKSNKNLSREEKGEIVSDCIKQLSPPEYVHQDLLSLFLKTGKYKKVSVEYETKTHLPKEEEKEYKVYSHENTSNPTYKTFTYVNAIDDLSEEDMAQRFDIFYFPDKKTLKVRGIKVPVFTPGKKGSVQIQKALPIFLRNVGRSISFDFLEDNIWKDETPLDIYDSIKQLRKRIGSFTKGVTNKYISVDKNEQRVFILATDNKDRKFKYCLVERK